MDLGVVWVSVITETLQLFEIYRDSLTDKLPVSSPARSRTRQWERPASSRVGLGSRHRPGPPPARV